MSAELIKKLKFNDLEEFIVLNDETGKYFKENNIRREYSSKEVNNVVLFVKSGAELKEKAFDIIDKDLLKINGRLVIAYPKKGNKLYNTYVSRDEIHSLLEMDEERYAKGSNYKFNQLISFDEIFTAMIIKKVDKNKTKKIDKSQRTCTYTDKLDILENKLSEYKEAYDFYIALTPGYKNSWARYIYSAKQESTQERRFLEAVKLLENKVKTKN